MLDLEQRCYILGLDASTISLMGVWGSPQTTPMANQVSDVESALCTGTKMGDWPGAFGDTDEEPRLEGEENPDPAWHDQLRRELYVLVVAFHGQILTETGVKSVRLWEGSA